MSPKYGDTCGGPQAHPVPAAPLYGATAFFLKTKEIKMGFGKDGMGVIIKQSISQAILTLATDTGLLITAKPATLERFRMLKTEVYANVEGLSEQGRSLSLWLADGDLSLAEIEEAIELTAGPLGPNDPVNAAIAERPVWFLGSVGGGTPSAHVHDREANGTLCVLKPRWTFARTKSWNFVLYNIGAAPTTGATINLRVKNFGVWVT